MGIFITFEGIDGSGKTTLSKLTCQTLIEKRINAVMISKKDTDYSSSYLSHFMKQFGVILWDNNIGNPVYEVTDHAWLFIHAAWYRIMAENLINPKLKEYDVVLLDGWFYKILSRFMAKSDFNNDLVDKVFGILPRGDLVIYLNADVIECYNRKKTFTDAEIGVNEKLTGSVKDRFVKYQEAVKMEYFNLAHKNNWNIINANNSLDEMSSKVMNVVMRKYNECKNSSDFGK